MQPISVRAVARRPVTASHRGRFQDNGSVDETKLLMTGKAKAMKEAKAMETAFQRWTRLSLEAVLLALVAAVVIVLPLLPTPFAVEYMKSWRSLTKTPEFGFNGIFGILWGAPIFLIVLLGYVYLYLFPRSSRRPVKKPKRASMGTHPVIVSGPFGVLSMSELLGIVIFGLIMTWIIGVQIHKAFVTSFADTSSEDSMIKKILEGVAMRLGFTGVLCLGLLFLPISRGSVLLRLIDIPFEHATKYHVWLGHFTMTIFSVHGFLYLSVWKANGTLLQKVITWKNAGISNFPGAIALSAGLLMWATSFQYTRMRAFELFYYTHHLYIIFIIFMSLHVGDFFFGLPFAGIFIFTFDRFLRFIQSRKVVGVLSAKALPSGTFELVLAKPANLHYNALSFAFINIPKLNRLQWHPFSVSSSPRDGPDSIKFLIKPLGNWTRQVNKAVVDATRARCPFDLRAAVEGPYGHETSYFLDYDSLLLVAGGIGITPFIAVIRDILHRYQQNEANLPKDVTLIWAVKKHEELSILDTLHATSICPGYPSRLNLIVKAHVTQEEEMDVVEAAGTNGHVQSDTATDFPSTKYDAVAAQRYMSPIVGSGNILWVGAAFTASLFGYLLVTDAIGKIYKLTHNSKEVMTWYSRGAGVVVGILVGVWLFGGSVILAWFFLGSRPTKKQNEETQPLIGDSVGQHTTDIVSDKLVQRSNIVFGCRPDLREVFEGCGKRLSGSNVGVLVCGPEGLQSSVANLCRAFNTTHYNLYKVGFSYHSVSFDL